MYKNPGSFLPITNEANVPPTMAISEFTATRPETPSRDCADITLKPNQPTVSIHDPKARNGILDGGNALSLPSFVYRPSLGPKIKTAAKAIHPPIA